MKLKYSFLTFLIICVLIFTTCASLDADEEEGMVIVEPMIQTQWAQRSPYNNMMVNAIRNRTGCGTTAMAQIMKFYEYPEHGIGQSESYTTGIGTIVPALNFEATVYDWGNMLNTYSNANSGTDTERNAVATLMYHAAVGFRINDVPTGRDGGTTITRMINAMTTYFGYDKSMQRRSKIYFDDVTWEKIIRDQLDAGMPVFGHSPGHYYIIDGYDNNGKFHFNWGWNGKSDGWYPLSVDWRNLGGDDADSGEDDDSQNIIINIKPDEGGVSPGYEIGFTSFYVQKTSVIQNEQFEVYVQMKNINPEHRFLGGTARVELVDNNGNSNVIGTSSMGEGSSWTRLEDRPINCSVLNTVPKGQYKLRIATRPTGGEWKVATLSIVGVPNSIDFTVR